MPNQLRYRSGTQQLVKVRVDADTVIEAGDLVFLNTDDARPAAMFPWTSDLSDTQEAFAEYFLGIAHEPSPAGESASISVDVSPLSVYEMDVVAANYEVGQVLGPHGAASTLKNQQLATVTIAGIARAVEFGTNKTTLRMTFASAFHTASGNSHASVG